MQLSIILHVTRVATVTVTIYLDTPLAGVSLRVGQEKDPPLTDEL